ncbi:MAG: hypothetical protein ACR2JI_08095 [Mycobacterium sp.]
MNPGPVPISDTLAADSAALAGAASAAEEALCLEREALGVLRDGWTSDSGSAASDFIESHCREGEAVVAALRHAAMVLQSLGDTLSTGQPADPATLARDEAHARLGERAPSAFPAPDAPAIPASAPAMNWPASVPAPALPDVSGAIAGLVAQIVDALGTDPADPADAAPVDAAPAGESQTRPDPFAEVTKPPAVMAPTPAPVQPVAPVEPLAPTPVDPAPLLAAEAPPPDPAQRTPCEIAADELPQVGQ